MKIPFLSELTAGLLAVLFPQKCVNCKKEGELLCEACFQKIHPLRTHGVRWKDPVIKIFSYAPYEGVMKKILLNFKFNRKKEFASIIGSFISKIIPSDTVGLTDISLLPVPLHPTRKMIRTFNQAELIAEMVSSNLNLPILRDSVKRVKRTEYMSQLSNKERMKNIKNAFKVSKPEIIKGKNIIIIDDILTTGATITTLAGVLQKAGAVKIFAATAARVSHMRSENNI